jgi:putative ABC transport system permease protein
VLTILRDLNHAVRGLHKSPALVVVAIASLALGVGANVTVYSVVRELILDNLSARHPDRLTRADAAVNYARYRELRDTGVFQDLAFASGLGNVTWAAAAHKEVAWQMSTSTNFFDVLGVGASAGRLSARRG